MKNRRISFWFLVGLLVIELVLTGFLSYKSATSVQSFCVIGQEAGSCDSVQGSGYGSLFGIKLGYLGLFSFLVLSAVLFLDLGKKKLSKIFVWLSFVGAVFAIYLVYVQLFVLGQICTTCMFVDGIAILIFFVSLSARKAPLV